MLKKIISILFIAFWSLTTFNMLFSQVQTNENQNINNRFWMRSPQNGVVVISAKGYFGLADTLGNVLCEPKYDEIGAFENGSAIIQLNGKLGLIDNRGKELVSPKYEQIQRIENSKWSLIKLNSKWGALDHSGTLVVNTRYDRPAGTFLNHALLATGNNFDLISISGEIIRLPETIDAAFLSNGVIVLTTNGLSGLMNMSGEIIVPLEYNGLFPLKNELTIYLKNGKRGIFKNGKSILSMEYDFIDTCEIGFKVGVNAGNLECIDMSVSSRPIVKWGLLDSNTKLLIPCVYDQIGNYSEGYATVTKHNSCKESVWGAINSKGEQIIPFNFQYVGNYSDGLFFANRGGKSEYLNASGEVKFNCRKGLGSDFSGGFALIKKRDLIGIINSKGQQVVRPRYVILNQITPFTYLGQTNDKSCLIVISNGKSVETDYETIEELSNNILKVQNKGLFGIIDARTGKIILPIIYADIQAKENGALFILKKTKSDKMNENTLFDQEFYFGLADLSGEILVECKFEEILSFSEGFAPIRGSYNWGFISKSGELLVPLEYNDVRPFNNGIAAVRKDSKWGAIDKNGIVVIPIEYDKTDYDKAELEFFQKPKR